MKATILMVSLLTIAVLVSSGCVQQGSGAIEGYVYDELGTPVNNAVVEISFSSQSGISSSSFSGNRTTHENGYFKFEWPEPPSYLKSEDEYFPAGTYDITVCYEGVCETGKIKVERDMKPVELTISIHG